jgi:3-methyladenine DNA glycosylase/8-oxoguanine DNA glycosylase
MPQTLVRIRTPKDFDFASTVYSHGWCSLPPFFLQRSSTALERILSLSSGTLVTCTVRGGPGLIRATVESPSVLSSNDRAELRQVIRHCFRLDENLVPFHQAIASDPYYQWIAKRRAGRLLRAPTVYEDLVKIICTTNCSWSLTTAMVINLCTALGEQYEADRFAFPSPHRLASSSEAFLRTRIKAGYRAPFLLGLARSIDSGAIDPEQWLDPAIPAEELYDQLREIRGVGDYAAGNLLRLLGRYDYLGLDSWVRTQYYSLHHGGRKVKDTTIARRYQHFGRWRGLLFWLEMTRHWYDQKFPLAP